MSKFFEFMCVVGMAIGFETAGCYFMENMPYIAVALTMGSIYLMLLVFEEIKMR